MWALLWHTECKLDGITEHFIYENCVPKLFKTRAKARKYAIEKYEYIKYRKDLRKEPHCWKIPRPIKCRIEKS